MLEPVNHKEQRIFSQKGRHEPFECEHTSKKQCDRRRLEFRIWNMCCAFLVAMLNSIGLHRTVMYPILIANCWTGMREGLSQVLVTSARAIQSRRT